MVCDMCGSEGRLYKAVIEGAKLNVCTECSKFGKVTGIVKQEEPPKAKPKSGWANESREPQKEVIEIVSADYAEKIRKKREQLGLKQEEFAKKISEKESLIQKIESGHFEPSISLAKKIGNFLKIKLVEEHEETHERRKETKADTFTIGDFIKIKEK
ncbi:multiprotein bridging factor aMBF1 [Candidatus Woesearchaeota archaeon]|nr:multiprotein bridging factor aMBF1 [Candidatus Woesearchaeota archaeon]